MRGNVVFGFLFVLTVVSSAHGDQCAVIEAAAQARVAQINAPGEQGGAYLDIWAPPGTNWGGDGFYATKGFIVRNTDPGWGYEGFGNCYYKVGGPPSTSGGSNPPPNCPSMESGSIIIVDNQSLGESIEIPGTEFSLVYRSDRQLGRKTAYSIRIPVRPPSMYGYAAPYTSRDVTVAVAGQTHTVSLDPSTYPTDDYTFVWDGKDALGAVVGMPTTATVTLTDVGCSPDPCPVITTDHIVGNINQLSEGLGGWGLNAYHHLDVQQKRLYKGDGVSRVVTLNSISGGGYWVVSEDGLQMYMFSSANKHVQTRSTLTGATLYTFTHDSQGRLSSVTDGYGKTTSISRSSTSVTLTAPFGQQTELTLDTDGYAGTITLPGGDLYSASYTSDGNMLSFADPTGRLSQFTYDALGFLTSDSTNSGSSKTFSRSLYSDALGSESGDEYLIQMTTTEGLVTSYRIKRGVLNGNESTTITKPDGGYYTSNFQPQLAGSMSAAFTWSGPFFDSVSLSSAPDIRFGDQVGFMSYRSQRGVSISSAQAVSALDANDPSVFGTLTEQHTVNGSVWTSVFSQSSRQTVLTSPVGRVKKSTVNLAGDVTQVQHANYVPIDMTYNSLGQLSQVSQSARLTTLQYNTSGYLSSITDPMSNTLAFGYDAKGRLSQVTKNGTQSVYTSYDARNRLTSVITPTGFLHSLGWGFDDTLASYTFPFISGPPDQISYTYNDDGKRTQVLFPSGKSVQYSYDLYSGNLNSITTDRGTSTVYSFAGKITQANTADGVASNFSYTFGDTLDSFSTTLSNLYSNVTRDFNAFALPAHQYLHGSGGLLATVAYEYDNDGLLKKAGSLNIVRDLATGNVASTSIGSLTHQQTYDTLYGELLSKTYKFGTNTIYSNVVTRDLLGRIATETEVVSGVTTLKEYSYDTYGRLSEVKVNGSVTAQYSYDLNGNRTSVTRGSTSFTVSYDEQDRISSTSDGRSFLYTQDGHLSSIANSLVAKTFEFDSAGVLTKVVPMSGTSVTYISDIYGRRVMRKLNSTVSYYLAPGEGTQYVARYSSTGALQQRYVYGLESHVPDYLVIGSTNYRLITDIRGSVRLVVNASNGTIVQRIDYDEFGRVTNDTSPGYQPFGFAGGLYDKDTKMVRFGQREYDPEMGRWLSKDPILFAGGDANLYGYVLNDPINFIDPSGLAGDAAGATPTPPPVPSPLPNSTPNPPKKHPIVDRILNNHKYPRALPQPPSSPTPNNRRKSDPGGVRCSAPGADAVV